MIIRTNWFTNIYDERLWSTSVTEICKKERIILLLVYNIHVEAPLYCYKSLSTFVNCLRKKYTAEVSVKFDFFFYGEKMNEEKINNKFFIFRSHNTSVKVADIASESTSCLIHRYEFFHEIFVVITLLCVVECIGKKNEWMMNVAHHKCVI